MNIQEATQVYEKWMRQCTTVVETDLRSKGITILAPILVKQPNPSAAPPQGKDGDIFRLSGFRAAYVFDVQQTEGRPLPAFATTTGDPKDAIEKLKNLVAKQGIALDYDSAIAPAQGVSTGGRIRLLPGLSAAEEFSVLTHELAHEMLHHQKEGPPLPKVLRETQAEAVAFVVCRAVGLETNTAAADYIALYNGDKTTLAQSLAVIQETSGRILDEVLPEQRLTPAEQRTAGVTPAKSQSLSPAESLNPGSSSSPPQGPPSQSDSVSWDR